MLFNFFGQIQGQAPKNPKKATRLCHQTGIDGFAPLVDGTHRRLQSKRDGRSY